MRASQPFPRSSSTDLEKIAQAYDSEPWWYDVRGFFILTFAYRSTLGAQLKLFGESIGHQHLECAIGSGTLLDLVLKWRRWKKLTDNDRIVGFDYAAPMLAGALRRFGDNPAIELHLADVGALEFPDATFDTANIANAIHCFPDVDAGLREVNRVLKPGGTLAVNVLLFPRGPALLRWIAQRINDWGMKKGILHTPYFAEDIRDRFVRAGFQSVRERVSGNTLNAVLRKPLAG